MADAKAVVEKHEPPKELPYVAQTQKTLGKAKRSPDDQAEYFYNQRYLHITFFVSSALLLGSLLLMFVDDYSGVTPQANRDWKHYQLIYGQLDFGRLQDEMASLAEGLKAASDELSALDRRIEKFEKNIDDPAQNWAVVRVDVDRRADLERLAKEQRWSLETRPDAERIPEATCTELRTTEEDKQSRKIPYLLRGMCQKDVETLISGVAGEYEDKQMQLNHRTSDKMAVRWRFEEAEQHLREARKNHQGEDHAEELYKVEKEKWDDIFARTEQAKIAFDAVNWKRSFYDDLLTAIRKPLTTALSTRAKLRKEYEEKEQRYKGEKPQLANLIRNAPMLDFFDPTIKIQQVVLGDIREDFHFAKIERVDRCHTCHKGIANPIYEAEKVNGEYRFKDPFLRSYVEHAQGKTKQEKCEICNRAEPSGSLTVQIKHGSWPPGEAERYMKTLMAHPRLDLYVLGSTPHALEKIGCTSCHEGDGRETEFSRAVHVPSSEGQRKEWEERYHYHYRELWDRPMLPMTHVYASCRKCHREQVELPYSQDYQKGMLLYERAGCYACHRTDTYQWLPKDTSDPKLDPVRKVRRPGPPLTHIRDKVSKEWMREWILRPKEFRLTARMPTFFGQSNARTITVPEGLAKAMAEAGGASSADAKGATYEPAVVESTIVSAMVEYLFETSQTRQYPALPHPSKGDVRRGEMVFEQIGCRACHVTTPDGKYARRSSLRNKDDTFRAPEGESWYLKEFGPNLAGIGTKLGAGTLEAEKGRTWLYNWIRDPEHYFKETRMPKMRPQDKPEMEDQELMDLVEYLMSLKKERGKPVASPGDDRILNYLIYEQLRLKMPDVDALAELGVMKQDPQAKTLWFGRKMVANYGCYACHELRPEGPQDVARIRSRLEIPIDWTNIEGIAVEMTGAQPEGIKAVDRLDFGYTHVDELGNHRGVSFNHGFTGEEYHHVDPESPNPSIVQVHHSRHDWIRNKLLDPRVFDGGKLGSKPPDELLRMPNFYFSAEEARAVTTFVLSFTDHDIPANLVSEVKKRFTADGVAMNRAERLIRESNCRACHRFQLDRFEVEHKRKVKQGEKEKEVTTWEWIEGREKGELSPSDAEAALAAWGLPVSKSARIVSYDWTSDGKTLRMEPARNGDGSVVTPQTQFVLFDGSEQWLIDGTTTKLVRQRRIRVYVPQEGGEIIAHIREFKRSHASEVGIEDVKNVGHFENRIPPMLRTQGQKTQADWLFQFLKMPTVVRPALVGGRAVPPEHRAFIEGVLEAADDPELEPKQVFEAVEKAVAQLPQGEVQERVAARVAEFKQAFEEGKVEKFARGLVDLVKVPELNVRMPTFGFTDEEAGALVRYFWVRDHAPGKSTYPYTSFPEREPETVERAMSKIRETLESDVKRTCMQCHFVEGKPPSDRSVTKLGPDLADVQHRLRPEWLHAWMQDPASIHPGTTMVRERFDDDVERRRANVIWMLNYGKLGVEPK